MRTTIALVLFTLGVTAAVKAAEYTPIAPRPATDVTWTPASVEIPVVNTLIMPEVHITAKAPRKPVVQKATCGAFAPRALVQGSGSVRGFCS